MKKLWLLLALFAAASPARADSFWSSFTTEEPVTARYTVTAVATSTSVIVVDLSSTTAFPHKFTGALNIFAANIEIDKVATSSGTVKLGVVTRVDSTNSDIKWFYEKSFDRSAAGTEIVGVFEPAAPFRLRVNSAAATPFLASNDTTTNSTTFQTDVVLPNSANASLTSGVGDIVLSFTNNGAVATDFDLEVIYNSER